MLVGRVGASKVMADASSPAPTEHKPEHGGDDDETKLANEESEANEARAEGIRTASALHELMGAHRKEDGHRHATEAERLAAEDEKDINTIKAKTMYKMVEDLPPLSTAGVAGKILFINNFQAGLISRTTSGRFRRCSSRASRCPAPGSSSTS